MSKISTTGYNGGPQIVFASNGTWTPIIGHACSDTTEAEEYCSVLGSGSMHVVYDGEELPECPAPVPPRTLSHTLNPESVRIIYEALKDF